MLTKQLENNYRNIDLNFKFFINIITMNLLLVGPFASYLNMPKIYWLSYISFLFIAFLNIYRKKLKIYLSSNISLVFILFMSYLIINMLFFTDGLNLRFIAIKDYIIPFFMIISCLVLKFKDENLEYIYKKIRLVSLVQVPFVFHQYFFLSRTINRDRLFDWDVIAGTFGFNGTGGGGNSAGLLLFQLYFVTMAISRVRLGRASSVDWVALVLAITTVFFVEAKVVFVLVFFVLAAHLSWADMLRVKVLLSSLCVVLLFVVLLLVVYNKNFSVGFSSGANNRSVGDYLSNTYQSYFVNHLVNYETGEVSRWASIDIWISRQSDRDWPVESYLGYGLTSSKFSNNKYPDSETFGSLINFASIQLTTYLWDIGILGASLYYCLLCVALFFSIKVKNSLNKNVCTYGRGSFFVLLSMLCYSIYSPSLHVNPVSISVIALALPLGLPSSYFSNS